MEVLSKDKSNLYYDAAIPPALTVAPGELFQLETVSILTRLESFPDDVTVPVTGPVYVEGARVGSVLKVDIVKIELTAGEGAIIAVPGKGAFAERTSEAMCKVTPYDDKYVYFNDTIKIPLRPMVGKIGVAPLGDAIKCNTPGPHGGNMDITDITEGSSVYLPVFVEGALLACGDAHAAMGDGETCSAGVETESLLTLSCQVIEEMQLTHPLVATEKEVMMVGEGHTLEESYRIALDNMVEFISDKLGLSFIDATMLMSTAADIRINQIVNPLVGVRVAFPLSLLPPNCIP